MEDKQKKILALIEKLGVGIMPSDAVYHLSFLSEEDIDKLLQKLEDVDRYQSSVRSLARQVDPEEFDSLEGQYEDELLELKQKFSQDSEALREKLDGEEDAAEADFDKKTISSLHDAEDELDEIERQAEEEYSKLTS